MLALEDGRSILVEDGEDSLGSLGRMLDFEEAVLVVRGGLADLAQVEVDAH